MYNVKLIVKPTIEKREGELKIRRRTEAIQTTSQKWLVRIQRNFERSLVGFTAYEHFSGFLALN